MSLLAKQKRMRLKLERRQECISIRLFPNGTQAPACGENIASEVAGPRDRNPILDLSMQKRCIVPLMSYEQRRFQRHVTGTQAPLHGSRFEIGQKLRGDLGTGPIEYSTLPPTSISPNPTVLPFTSGSNARIRNSEIATACELPSSIRRIVSSVSTLRSGPGPVLPWPKSIQDDLESIGYSHPASALRCAAY